MGYIDLLRMLGKVTVHGREADSDCVVGAHAKILHKCTQRQTDCDAELEGCVLRFTEQNVAGFGCNIRESLRGFQEPVCLEQACSLALVTDRSKLDE